jgi:hypothetical protein
MTTFLRTALTAQWKKKRLVKTSPSDFVRKVKIVSFDGACSRSWFGRGVGSVSSLPPSRKKEWPSENSPS